MRRQVKKFKKLFAEDTCVAAVKDSKMPIFQYPSFPLRDVRQKMSLIPIYI
jgi:hypothetical protein